MPWQHKLVHIYIYIYIHTNTRSHTFIFKCIYIYIHAHTQICTHIHAYIHTYIHTNIYVCVFVRSSFICIYYFFAKYQFTKCFNNIIPSFKITLIKLFFYFVIYVSTKKALVLFSPLQGFSGWSII
jgi:hypothetical protein